MKKNLLLLLALISGAFTLFAQPIYNEDGIRLYHTPSQEEIEWAQRKGIVVETAPTAPPPTGQIRPIAEFEPAEAVLVRYPFGIPISLIKDMANDVKVITVVASASEQNTVLNQYNSNGVNTANCQFLIANTDSYWTRDYGPWFMAVDNSNVAMFDFTYNRPRPNDNQVNGKLATYLSNTGVQIDRYASTLSLTGGNFMNDGIKQAASSTLTLNENSGGEQAIRAQFQQYLGIEPYHFIPDCIVPYDQIQHIDCWGKFLSPNKVLIDSVAPGSSNFAKFEAAANYFRDPQVVSSWGMPYQVYRVFAPGATSSSPKTPYSNSLILNKKVYVPIGGNTYDNAALQVYQQAMPGYTIIPVTQSSSTPWLNTDALHCRTHEIADRCMLYVKHQPRFGNIENTGSLTFSAELYSYCNNPIKSDSVIVYVKVAGSGYTGYNMTNIVGNTWETTVSGLPNGLIEYYIFAADNSNRRECHPYIGASDPHKFNLIGNSNLPVLAIDKTSSTVISESIEIINDYITISNVGDGELSFEITNMDFSEMLTVTPLNGIIQPNSFQTITLSYNFANVENGVYTGSCKLVSNDPSHATTQITLSATQILPVLSLSKTLSEVSGDSFDEVEDYITVYNLGNANLTFEITDIFSDMNMLKAVTPTNGTVAPQDSVILSLFYDFPAIDKGSSILTGSFKLLSNDPLQPETVISCYADVEFNAINEANLPEIRIYPNPANEVIEVFYEEGKSTKAYIYSVFGQQFKEITLSQGANTIDIHDLSSGVYFIKVEARAFKFVKQ